MIGRKESGERSNAFIVKTIESGSVFWFDGGVKFLVGDEVIKNDFGSLIERLGGDERGEFFFLAE